MEYNWKIDKLEVLPIDEVNGLTNVVKTAFYTVTAISESGTESSLSNCASIFYSEGREYADFDDLTETIVMSWIKNFLGKDGIDTIEECLSQEISFKENPTTIKTVLPPWIEMTS